MTNPDVPPDAVAIGAQLAGQAAKLRTELTGPIHLQSVTSRADRGVHCEGLASVFVPLEGQELGDVGIAIPVKLTAELSSDGTLTSLELAGPEPEERRQAQAYASSVLARGEVRGHPAAAVRRGPPVRPTHEIMTDALGRKVLVRTGFAAGGRG